MRAITAEPVIARQLTLVPLRAEHATDMAIVLVVYSRLTRGSLLDALGEDCIRTARARGLSERRAVYRHGLRSALIPVTTQLGVDLATDQNRIRIASSW